jgi:glutathione S-transferase
MTNSLQSPRMRTLYHFPLSAESRMARLVLREKGLAFQTVVEPFWERREDFLMLNPAGEVPVLVEEDGSVVAGTHALLEYLDEVAPLPLLIGATPGERAETRRLVSWFRDKFAFESTRNILGEKVIRRFNGAGQPNSEAIRAGMANLRVHLDYVGWLTERRTWLAGPSFTLADIAAAAHLSVLDYLGDVPWSRHDAAHEWYARVKSRPSFRAVLEDRVPGIAPAAHYGDLDF